MADTPTSPKNALLNHKFHGCSSISSYEIISKLGEGTFGEVHKARSRSGGKVVALKKILMHNEKDGFPVTAIREIKLLKQLSHVNILHLEEMAVERPKVKDRKQKAIMYMVTPYMEHDLSGLLTNPDVRFTEPQIKCYMLQLLEGLRYLHSSQILHRDMKAANLLISNKGILQIADFGLARHYDEPPPRKGQGGKEAQRDYTALVVTRWYRPPELLLSLRRYTPAIDLWGVGCVFGEMFKGTPILQGQTDLAQLEMIVDLVGAPTEETMPGWSKLPGCDNVFRSFEPNTPTLPQKAREWNVSGPATALLTDLLKLDWRKRITAVDALDHPYFKTPPLPAKPGDLPTFEDSHELDHRRHKGKKAALPPAPAGGTVGIGPNGGGDWAGPGTGGSAHANGGLQGSRPPSRNDRPRGPPPTSAAQYDRGPAPTQQYDSRRPPTSGTSAPPPAQRPGWARETHELPPKPPPRNAEPPTNGQGSGGRGSSGPPLPPPGGKDTYIPSYSDAQPRRNPPPGRDDHATRRPRDDRDYRDRDRDREYTYRDRDRNDRDRNRDRDDRREPRERVEIDRYAPPTSNRRSSTTSHHDRHQQERSNGLDYNERDRDSRDRDRERDRPERDSRPHDDPGSSRKRTRSPSLDADVRERERKTRERGDTRERDREGSREVFGRR